jgi:hypothetical protein
MAHNLFSTIAATSPADSMATPESRTEQSKSQEKQGLHVWSETLSASVGDRAQNNRWSKMTNRTFSNAQALHMLNGFALGDNTTLIADNSATREAKGDQQKHKDMSDAEHAELADLHKTVDAIRNSGILTAPGRTGGGNVEYKMVIFRDGAHTTAYQNQYVGTDLITHSDVFMSHPDLEKEILINTTIKFNPLAKLVHSHPNKKGMEPYVFSKEDIAESNGAHADSILIGPDGRVFLHRSNPEGRLMNSANITDAMRIPDRLLGRFDAAGKFHPAKYHGKNVDFEIEGF